MNTQNIVAKLAAGQKLTAEEIAHLQAATAPKAARITLKVSAKGAVSVYGLGRFPVTLYAQQWDKLLGMADDIRAFCTEHKAELSQGKPEAPAQAPSAEARQPVGSLGK